MRKQGSRRSQGHRSSRGSQGRLGGGSRVRSRRGGRIAASAALVCLGAPLLGGCGGSDDEGYVAVGADDPSGRPGDSSATVRPDGKVRMVPLPGQGRGDGGERGSGADGGAREGGDGSGDGGGGRGGGTGDGDDGQGAAGSGDASAGTGAESSSDGAGGEGPGQGSSGSASPGTGTGTDGGSGTPSSGAPGKGEGTDGPALLTVSEPERAKAGKRWCEKVTVHLVNAGGRPVTGGSITFATHIIGGLGVDWATRESTHALPVPIDAGEKKEKSWTVCVDAWRVPLGMHVETREVKLSGWK